MSKSNENLHITAQLILEGKISNRLGNFNSGHLYTWVVKINWEKFSSEARELICYSPWKTSTQRERPMKQVGFLLYENDFV